MKRALLALLVLSLATAAVAAPPAEYVPNIEAPFPRLRFADGSMSLNDRCPVRKSKLNRKLAPVFVNGQPIGFC